MKSPSQIRVLLVDDEADLLETISSLFARFKFQVMTASRAQEAWDLILQHDFDVVVSDVRMPGMDGVELLKRVRERSHERPTFLFTSGYSDQSLAALYDLGADGFFSKPMGASTIRDAIVRAVVPREVRWMQIVTDPERKSITARLTSIEEAMAKKTLRLGRGGFFFGPAIPLAPAGQTMDFELLFESGELTRLAGQGLVRWSQARGMGVEITALETEAREFCLSWIAKHAPRAFIPNWT